MSTTFVRGMHPTQPTMRFCSWCGLTLHAWEQGAWKVIEDGEVLAHWEEQTTGKNLKDAQQRAQAAAMVQLKLRLQQPKT